MSVRNVRQRRRMLVTALVAAASAVAGEHFLKPSLKKRLRA